LYVKVSIAFIRRKTLFYRIKELLEKENSVFFVIVILTKFFSSEEGLSISDVYCVYINMSFGVLKKHILVC
jgi:hypothetical protein